MILYVNGDSHTAGAEIANSHAFAADDPELFHLGRLPHPDNLARSWGKLLSLSLAAEFHCDAESAASNTRILRTSREWLTNNKNLDKLVIIQWSTWEREEWLINGTYYQVNGSGIDQVPQEAQERYRNYVIGLNWQEKIKEAYKEIWGFHKELEKGGIKHIFFNGNNDFSKIQNKQDWALSYIHPYDPKYTFNSLIRAGGFEPVGATSWHFGKDAHSFFAQFMLQYITDNNLL